MLYLQVTRVYLDHRPEEALITKVAGKFTVSIQCSKSSTTDSSGLELFCPKLSTILTNLNEGKE